MTVRILTGDCRTLLASLEARSVQTCVTSPPYFGLRDYGVAGQIGLEATPDAFVAELVAVFREVRRVLRDDGTLWLNLGDSYAGSWGAQSRGSFTPGTLEGASSRDVCLSARQIKAHPKGQTHTGSLKNTPGIKAKDLIGIPWMVAFALRADGWYLRSDIIWAKPNPMPESVTDRPTKSHEYLFLLSKAPTYYYDGDAIAEPFADASLERLRQDVAAQRGSDRVPGKTNGPMRAVGNLNANRRSYKPGSASNMNAGEHVPKSDEGLPVREAGRNKRSVWTVTTMPYKGAHFATFPPALIEPCILAGSRPGDTVLDPFFGAGTTGLVADRLGRHCVGVELNPEYAAMARARITADAPLFSDGAA
jgi:DNA modification methylase